MIAGPIVTGAVLPPAAAAVRQLAPGTATPPEPPPEPTGDVLLLESGDRLLLESGDRIVLEDTEWFRIVILPDTQIYVKDGLDTFVEQCQWIADNAEPLRIAAVLHEGDVVDSVNETQLGRADAAIAILDAAEVPYLLAIGNHDYANPQTGRDSTGFNAVFSQARYSDHAWWDGGFYEEGRVDNAYLLLTAGGADYLLLSLEFGARDGVLAWADALLTTYADRKAIVVTHAYLGVKGQRLDADDTNTPSGYTLDGDVNNGEEIWDALIKKHANVVWVQSGHDFVGTAGNAAFLLSLGTNGNPVPQGFANYQGMTGGGEGWLRVLTISTTYGVIGVRTYSPARDGYRTGATEQFAVRVVNG